MKNCPNLSKYMKKKGMNANPMKSSNDKEFSNESVDEEDDELKPNKNSKDTKIGKKGSKFSYERMKK